MDEKKRTIIGCVCMAIAGALIVSGFLNGSTELVFSNAAGICLRCIGIG